MKNFSHIFLFVVFTLNYQNAFAKQNSLAHFTDGPAKLVWLQDKKGGADSLAHSDELTVWGLDSQDDNGERQLIAQKGNWFKPLFTPDGKKVIVSNRKKREIYQLDWENGKVQKIGSGVAVALWQEPNPKFFSKKKTWLYFFDGEQGENKYFTAQPLYRTLLDQPKRRELVWNKSEISWSSIGISRDGKIMGGLFPWPNGGIIPLQDGSYSREERFQRLGKGCWTSLSPDNSYVFWIFDGLHRNLQFFDTKNGTKWITRINGIPGNTGNFEVYHPLWSNDVRFFTVTGFYEKGEGGNRIGGGGDNIEIYIGKFSSDMRSVGKWFQVTNNERADYYPALWLQNGEEQNLTLTKDVTEKKTPVQPREEPLPQKKELIFIWDDSKAPNQLSPQSPIGYYQVQIQLRGEALYTANLQLDLENGFAETADAGMKIMEAIIPSKKMTIEATVTPKNDTGHGSIIQLGNFIKIQQDGEHVIVVTNNEKKVGWKKIFKRNTPISLAFTFDDKQIELFVEGKSKGKKDFSPLPEDGSKKRLTFGDNKWAGKIEGIAFYNTLLAQNQIVAKAKRMQHKISQHKESKTVKINATLAETTEIPSPNALGAYSRALVVNTYIVNEVLSGQYPNEKIVVAEWAVLDRTIVKNYPETPQPEEFVVQKFDTHPELEGERQMVDIFEPDLEMWYRLLKQK